MDVKFDDSELALEADNLIKTFQKDALREAGIFHHLITFPLITKQLWEPQH
ncbi:MAG: hypothetical protein Ct9H90mP22_1510 [Gammaproteobacteria bacterium]|nr:MAG: hypothetical protein Ct9H90mP22_1510 [Gammaproteobacteria bacterium]